MSIPFSIEGLKLMLEKKTAEIKMLPLSNCVFNEEKPAYDYCLGYEEKNMIYPLRIYS